MLDAKANSVHVSVGEEDFEIVQSPGVLQSTRAGGTTGAAVWQASVRLAEWLAGPRSVVHTEYLVRDSTVLELGSGISGIVPLKLRSHVRRVVATDQRYLLKTLQENITTHSPRSTRLSSLEAKHGHAPRKSHVHQCPIDVLPLDWENDDIPSFLTTNDLMGGVDVIVVCDCVFNYALVDPLVQTCLEISQFRRVRDEDDGQSRRPTLSIVCQQLRQSEVFSQWLETFLKSFRVWRIPDNMLIDGLKEGSGFVIHVGILRD